MQETQVWPLVREDPIYCGATKPVCHNDWVSALEPRNRDYWAHVPRAGAPRQEKPPQWEEACTLQLDSRPCSETRESPRSRKDLEQSKISKNKSWSAISGCFHRSEAATLSLMQTEVSQRKKCLNLGFQRMRELVILKWRKLRFRALGQLYSRSHSASKR